MVMASPFDQPVSAEIEVDASVADGLASLGLQMGGKLCRTLRSVNRCG